jgi:hypothetical protein
MAMYCQSLTKANRALQHVATQRTDATLAEYQILAICEKHRPHRCNEAPTYTVDQIAFHIVETILLEPMSAI